MTYTSRSKMPQSTRILLSCLKSLPGADSELRGPGEADLHPEEGGGGGGVQEEEGEGQEEAGGGH